MRIHYGYSVALAALLLPFAYAMFFAFPLADDFGRAVLAHGLFDWVGGLHDLVWHWLHWSGRYTHHFLAVFLGDAVLTRAGYGAVCLGVFSLHGVALYGIFSQLAAGARRQERAFLTLASLAALAAGHEALNSTYYIVTDALGLGIGNAMVLMFIFALCRIWHLPALRRRDLAFALFCSAFAVGCYEHAAIAACVAAALALWMAWRCGHPHRNAYARIFGATVFFLLVSFLAPGNFSRQRIRAVTPDRILAQLLTAGRDWVAIAWSALSTHFAVLALFLGLSVTPRTRDGMQAVPRGQLVLAGLAGFIAVSAGIVTVHALSDVRATDIPKLPASIHLLLGAVLTYVLIGCAGTLRARLERVPAILLLLPLFLLFAASANTIATFRSLLTGQLDAYASIMTQRIAVIRATRNEDVRLAPLQNCPFPACLAEPIPASGATWPAAYIAALYAKRSVLTAPADESRAFASFLARPSAAWTRLPGSGIDAVYAALDPGPNATYRDGWIFVRAARPASPPAMNVLVVPRTPWGYLPAGFESARRAELFGAASFSLTAQHAFFGSLHTPRLAPVPVGDAAGSGVAAALLGAPLGLADPADVIAVFVSLDGSRYDRLTIVQQ